jgi:hypothetical protein
MLGTLLRGFWGQAVQIGTLRKLVDVSNSELHTLKIIRQRGSKSIHISL